MASNLTIGTTDLDHYIAGYEVEHYDMSSEGTTTNAKGDLFYKIVNDKYKVILTTTYLTQSELTAFLAPMYVTSLATPLTVKFFNPYTNSITTKTMYRGDRKAKLYWDVAEKGGKLYEPFTISLIEI